MMAGCTKPRIVIVGAGMAGISAAHHLVTSGLSNVKILEASDRIGGRIHTIQFGDGPMPAELGANWIHGAVMANSTFKLADSIGALSPYRIFNRMSGRFLREDGTEIGRDLVTFCWNIYREVSEKAEQVLSTGIKQGKRENLQTVLPRLFFDQVETSMKQPWNKDDITRVFNAFCNWAAFHEGDDLDKISFEFSETTCVMPGGNVHIPRGYRYLLDHLVKFLPENTIEFNAEVVKIQWKTSSDDVIITTKDGKGLVADHVIFTCSLGVLKKTHKSFFTPPLPPSKVKVINSIGFGCVDKILLEYDRPVTEIKSTNMFLSWLDNKIVNMDTEWVKGIVGFDLIYTKQNVLLGWISGKAAEHMETLSDDAIARGCTKLLRKFLGNPSFPEPKNIRVSRWGSNPFTRGSYSYQTPNLIPGEQDTLSEPLNSDTGSHLVLFAGEATHRENYSCTHGARDSGIREANRLLELYKDKVVTAKL